MVDIILTGFTESFGAGDRDLILIKTNPIGSLLWSKTYGNVGINHGFSVRQTIDLGYIILGDTWDVLLFTYQVYLIKTNSSGDTLWTKSYGIPNIGYGFSIQLTNDGGYVIAGDSRILGDVNLYLIKTDSSGNSGCNERNTQTIVTTPSITVTSPASIFTTPAPITPSIPTIVSNGDTITTLCTTVGITPLSLGEGLGVRLSPNPTTNNFTITFPDMINKGTIEIYNVLGEKMMEENIISTTQKEIHLKNINAGIYFVKVGDGERQYAEKFVVK